MSILIVDDSPDIRGLLAALLKAVGHTDLILMDITMPEVDGVEEGQRIFTLLLPSAHKAICDYKRDI